MSILKNEQQLFVSSKDKCEQQIKPASYIITQRSAYSQINKCSPICLQTVCVRLVNPQHSRQWADDALLRYL